MFERLSSPVSANLLNSGGETQPLNLGATLEKHCQTRDFGNSAPQYFAFVERNLK